MVARASKRDFFGRLVWSELLFEDRNHYVDEYVFGNPYRESVPRYMTDPSTPDLLGERFDDVFIECLEEEYEADLWRCVITHGDTPEVVAYGATENEALCFAALRAVGVQVTRK